MRFSWPLVIIVVSLAATAVLVYLAPKHQTAAAPALRIEHATIIDDIDLGNGEHLRVVEIPDRIMPYRCVILTSGGHSQLHCPADAAAAP